MRKPKCWEYKKSACWSLVCPKCGDEYEEDGYSPHFKTKNELLEHLQDVYYDYEVSECPCQKEVQP